MPLGLYDNRQNMIITGLNVNKTIKLCTRIRGNRTQTELEKSNHGARAECLFCDNCLRYPLKT